jgi:outer membrane protein OmpA-like peptidoglycan-associated protein
LPPGSRPDSLQSASQVTQRRKRTGPIRQLFEYRSLRLRFGSAEAKADQDRRKGNMKKRSLPVLLAVCCIGVLVWDAVGQAGELVTQEEFIQQLKTVDENGPKIRLRSIRVQQKPQPKVAIHILFETGSAKVTDSFSHRQLDEAGKALSSEALQGLHFEIAGHTDNVGTDDDNQSLSEARARAVKRFLVDKYHIDATRLTIRGYGETLPVASNESETGRARNRRVVFKRLD